MEKLEEIKNKIPKSTSDFELEEIDGELLLYSPTSTRSVYMNSTASIIWRLCDGNQSVAEIIALLTEAFPDAKQSIEKDVIDSIRNFSDNGAIELN